jgi:SAM-dependent methyltransferase
MTYDRSADVYDALYAWKDYAAEAARVRDLVEERRPGARTVLDVACGTGMHLAALRAWYEVEGVDLEPGLLEVARRRLPGVRLHEGDMRNFELDRQFDAVTCLFSSIGYMQSLEDLRLAINNMGRHLAPSGVLLIEPWLTPDGFTPGQIGGPLVGEADGLKVVRMNDGRVEGHLSIMEFHYLVGRSEGIEHVSETHTLGLYSADDYRAALEASGLRVEYDLDGVMGRGLWIGLKAG